MRDFNGIMPITTCISLVSSSEKWEQQGYPGQCLAHSEYTIRIIRNVSINVYVHIHVNTKCLTITECSNKWQVVLGRKQLPLSQALEDCKVGTE